MVDTNLKSVQKDLTFPRGSDSGITFDREAAMKSVRCCGDQARNNFGYGGSREYLMPDTLDQIKEGYLIFDVGCGNASQALDYSGLVEGGEVCCIDPSEEMIRKARRKINELNLRNVQAYEMDGTHLEPLVVKYGHPNLILLFNVLCYVPQNHAKAIVRACYNASDEGTKIICSTAAQEAHLMDAYNRKDKKKEMEVLEGRLIFKFEDEGVPCEAEGTLYSERELKELFISNGFGIDKFVSIYPDYRESVQGVPKGYYLIAKKNMKLWG